MLFRLHRCDFTDVKLFGAFWIWSIETNGRHADLNRASLKFLNFTDVQMVCWLMYIFLKNEMFILLDYHLIIEATSVWSHGMLPQYS